MKLRAISLFLVAALGVAAFACGGDDGEDAGPTPTPGTITVKSAAIHGQAGRMLLVLAAGKDGKPVARACAKVEGDGFSMPATVLTALGPSQDPCSGTSAPFVFPEGTYSVTAGIYAPPAQKAEKESFQTVEVKAAAVTVTLNAGALSK